MPSPQNSRPENGPVLNSGEEGFRRQALVARRRIHNRSALVVQAN